MVSHSRTVLPSAVADAQQARVHPAPPSTRNQGSAYQRLSNIERSYASRPRQSYHDDKQRHPSSRISPGPSRRLEEEQRLSLARCSPVPRSPSKAQSISQKADMHGDKFHPPPSSMVPPSLHFIPGTSLSPPLRPSPRLVPVSSLPNLSQDNQIEDCVLTNIFVDDSISLEDETDSFYKNEIDVIQPAAAQTEVFHNMLVDGPNNVTCADIEINEDGTIRLTELPAMAVHDNDEAEGNRVTNFYPFLEYLYFRFGFTFPRKGPEYPDISSWSFPLSDEDFNAMRRCVFDQFTAVNVTDDLRRDLYHFVTLLGTTEGPPASLWDLHPMNERYLVRANVQVKVDIIPASVENGEDVYSFYRLHVGQQLDKWDLYVLDPTVAVECLRREFRTTRDIAIFCLRRGTPFTLAFEGFRPNVSQLSSAVETRPPDFTPTQAHFTEWENAAREFMQTPRSRLVWKVGGFLWRLALYLVGATKSALALFDMAPGSVTRYVTPTAYEETLLDEEISILLGIFHIKSGKSMSVCSSYVMLSKE